jgi:hypothetical protein
MSFRTFLESQGLSQKDLEEAARESREVVETVQSVAGMMSVFLLTAFARTKNEKALKLIEIGMKVAAKVEAGSAELLKKR